MAYRARKRKRKDGTNKGPTVVEQVRDVIGEDALAILLKKLGGRRITVPDIAGTNHYLTQIIGQEAADKMCRRFNNDRIDLPMAERRRAQIVQALAKGMPKTEIAATYFVSERYVYKVQGEQAAADDDKQGRLF